MNTQLLSLCDTVLACDAVSGDPRKRWVALKRKAGGDWLADIFGRYMREG